MNELKYSIRYGTSNIRSRVLPDCVCRPLTKLARSRWLGSTSAASTSQGPRPSQRRDSWRGFGDTNSRDSRARVVVGDAVARKRAAAPGPRHAFRRAADDHGEFALVIMNLTSAGRRSCRVAEQGSGSLEKYQRLLLRAKSQFLRMIGIVEPQRDHRAGLERSSQTTSSARSTRRRRARSPPCRRAGGAVRRCAAAPRRGTAS